ncbi:MAG: response regulator [Cyclobacteriaceae bacterium]
MPDQLTCICIDDDPLLLRKLETYIEDIPWLTFLEAFNKPIKGASAIVSEKPDLVFLDIEMPMVDGNYVADWIGPKLELMEKPPKIIIVSSLTIARENQLPQVTGYINKANVTSPEALERMVKEILGLTD